MAEDQFKQEEQKLRPIPEGEALGYISLDQARILAMRTAKECPGAYGNRFKDAALAFEEVEAKETEYQYRIILAIVPEGNFTGTPGREQFFIEKEGHIAERRVLSLPGQGGWRRYLVTLVALGLVVVAAAAVAGVVAATNVGGSDDAAPLASPRNTPAPAEELTRAPITTPLAASPVVPDATSIPAPVPTATFGKAITLSLDQAYLAPLSMEVEGNGNQETERFVVAKGVMILTANYEGDGHFKVTIAGDEGQMEPSIDVDGPYFGNLLLTVFRGNISGMSTGGHTIRVNADGPWRIKLFQDFPFSGQGPTIQLGGVGDGGGGWMELKEGEYTIRAAHDGQSQFQVRLHEGRGAPESLVIDQSGPFEETVSLTVSKNPSVSNVAPGIYGIGVRADGIWSLIIEDPDNPAN